MKEQVVLMERKNLSMQGEVDDLRAALEQSERGRKMAEQETSDAFERAGLLQSQVNYKQSLSIF